MTHTPCLPKKSSCFSAPALCLAAASLLATPSFAQTQVADPNEEAGAGPLCCAVPPPDEVTADHVFGRWVVSTPGIAAKRAGERYEFRRDGTLQSSKGA